MIRVIRKWKITAYFNPELSFSPITLFISDDHYNNMLRKLSEINFGFDHGNPIIVNIELYQ